MIIHTSSVREVENNVFYNRSITINNLEDLKEAVKYDHIAGRMKNNRRGNLNFREADCLILDLDNSHSEDPAEWKSLDDISDAFPDVMFYAIQSRNYMKLKKKVNKDGTVTQYEPREKFHIYFPLSSKVDKAHYDDLILSAAGVFLYFDLGAVDSSHFIYGVKEPQGVFIEGNLTIDQYLSTVSTEEIKENILAHAEEMFSGDPDKDKAIKKLFEKFNIPFSENGNLNQSDPGKMSESISWLNSAEKARSIQWLKDWAAEYGVELGRQYEINTIKHPNTTVFCVSCPWESEHSMSGTENEAVIMIDEGGKLAFLCRHSHGYKYHWNEYRTEIERRSGKPSRITQLQPNHFTDLAQAESFVNEYGSRIRFSKATGFLVYDGTRWSASDEKARLLIHNFVQRQAWEAGTAIRAAQECQNRFYEELKGHSIEDGSEEQNKAAELKERISKARSYQRNAFKFQASGKITAILKEAAPKVTVEIDQLDADPFLLNTPAGAVDLRTGEIRPAQPDDLCTKITSCGPSDQGSEEWNTFLNQVTSEDQDLKNYLQLVFGMAAIGDVRQEKLLIPYGAGGNGKSTLCNAVSYVLGDYSGTLSAEALTMSSRKNVGPEYAGLRGKRLVIASELSEGMRLNTATVKQLCSTDPINADPKYKDPFSFRPSHTLVLFTNHLPKVGTDDPGTWSRLVVIPFNGVFRNTSGEIMNYASELAKRCGGAILNWTIDGARKFITSGYRLPEPEAVKNAIAVYREDNDWLSVFLSECCDRGRTYSVGAGDLQTEYNEFCSRTGEFKRNMSDLKAALENAGIIWRRDMHGAFYYGVRIKGKAYRPVSDTRFEGAQ